MTFYIELVFALWSLYLYRKTTEAQKQMRTEMEALADLSLGAAEELFAAYMTLRAKDGQTYAFVCNQPFYSRCDGVMWHGTIDGKLKPSREIEAGMKRIDRYSCSKKIKLLNVHLQDFIEDGAAAAVAPLNQEYLIEDMYYDEHYQAIVDSAAESHIRFTGAGFSNAGDIFSAISRVYDDIATGGAAAVGVFTRRAFDALNKDKAPRATSLDQHIAIRESNAPPAKTSPLPQDGPITAVPLAAPRSANGNAFGNVPGVARKVEIHTVGK